MFYEKQPVEQQEYYKKMLTTLGNLTLLFSESDCPYLPYRAHENIFCKYFEAENLARFDCSADAKKERIGIGLKTWMGQNDQKIAEFGKLRDQYKDLSGLDLVKFIAQCRNDRIMLTKNMYGIDVLIYHIVKRIPHSMQIIEYAFEPIDVNNISLIKGRGNVNNTYFTDKKHTYHFSVSKNTLYMIFENPTILEEFEVEIIEDPYELLMNLPNLLFIGKSYGSDIDNVVGIVNTLKTVEPVRIIEKNQLCLRLYSQNKNRKIVHPKSGLNQWNGTRLNSKTGIYSPRHPNELYIPYPVEDRRISAGFFPPRDVDFSLHMPDGSVISAKVCQDGGKAIMSNPNKVLGEWLLRKVFELPEGTVVTYEMLEVFGIDSVIFTKLDELKYKIDFAEIGTYEDYIENINE